jgi:hypothetical protein
MSPSTRESPFTVWSIPETIANPEMSINLGLFSMTSAPGKSPCNENNPSTFWSCGLFVMDTAVPSLINEGSNSMDWMPFNASRLRTGKPSVWTSSKDRKPEITVQSEYWERSVI